MIGYDLIDEQLLKMLIYIIWPDYLRSLYRGAVSQGKKGVRKCNKKFNEQHKTLVQTYFRT